jgi:hypothetical protein
MYKYAAPDHILDRDYHTQPREPSDNRAQTHRLRAVEAFP